jgi:hypothetical protein
MVVHASDWEEVAPSKAVYAANRAVLRFVTEFIAAGEQPAAVEAAYYAESGVAYFDKGLYDRHQILDDITRYNARWPVRRYGLAALASLTMANAQAIDDETFFKGIHLGMTFEEVKAYYQQFNDVGELWHSGALPGEKDFDFRTSSVPQRRIYFSIRTSNSRVISVMYWKLGDEETFSKEEVRRLTAQNKLSPDKLYSKLEEESGNGAELQITTEAEHVKQLRAGN